MTHAFAKDSRACAACVSWAGERTVSADLTLVHVARYSVEGECRAASSQDYRKVTRSYHTCATWAALPMLKAHGARPNRTPGPSAAMAGLMASGAVRSAPVVPEADGPVSAPPAPVAAAPVAESADTVCRATPLDIDRAPAQAHILYAHWRRQRGKRPLPTMRDIDPAQVRDCVSRICLLEPVAGGADFLYRACGRGVQRRMGRGPRPVSRAVSACHPSEAAARFVADLAACLRDGEPRCLLVRNDPLLPEQRFVELLLPLAGEDGRPAMVLAYRHVPGG